GVGRGPGAGAPNRVGGFLADLAAGPSARVPALARRLAPARPRHLAVLSGDRRRRTTRSSASRGMAWESARTYGGSLPPLHESVGSQLERRLRGLRSCRDLRSGGTASWFGRFGCAYR